MQTIENGEVVAGAMEAPVMVGMPLPPTTESPDGTSTNVVYSPIYNTRMKACTGYEAEGLKGYTTLDDLRHDLQLYFYDMNGYSYHRTAEVIAAELNNGITNWPSFCFAFRFTKTISYKFGCAFDYSNTATGDCSTNR